MGPPVTVPTCNASPQFYEARYTGKTQGTKRNWSKEGVRCLTHLWLMYFAIIKSMEHHLTLISWRKWSSGCTALRFKLHCFGIPMPKGEPTYVFCNNGVLLKIQWTLNPPWIRNTHPWHTITVGGLSKKGSLRLHISARTNDCWLFQETFAITDPTPFVWSMDVLTICRRKYNPTNLE